MSERFKAMSSWAAWVAIGVTVIISAWAFTLSKERGDATIEQKAIMLETRASQLESEVRSMEIELAAIRILLTRIETQQSTQQKMLEKIDSKLD